MIYSLQLPQAFYLVGLLLLLISGISWAMPAPVTAWLTKFPRSRMWGVGLMLTAAVWFFYLIYTIDLGEFGKWRRLILYIIPIATVLTIAYVEEFLAARALGMLVLLAAEPILEAAFLRPEMSRLFLVTLTYLLILVGMFWIGMPYLLRDQIRWSTSSHGRLRAVAGAAGAYGLFLVILGLTLHRSA